MNKRQCKKAAKKRLNEMKKKVNHDNMMKDYVTYPLKVRSYRENGDVIEYQIDGPEVDFQEAFEKAYEEFYGIEGADQDE